MEKTVTCNNLWQRVLSVVGFALLLIWFDLMGRTNDFLPPDALVNDWSVARVSFQVGVIIGCAIFIINPKWLDALPRATSLVLTFFSSAGAIAFASAYSQNIIDSSMLASTGLFLAGIGFIWFAKAFLTWFARFERLVGTIWSVVVALLIRTGLVPFVGTCFALTQQIVFVGTVPFILYGIVAVARRSTSEDLFSREKTGNPPREVLAKLLSAAFLVTAMMLLSISSFWEIGPRFAADPVVASAMYAMAAVLFVGGAYLFFVLPMKNAQSLNVYPAFFALITGVVVLALQVGNQPDIFLYFKETFLAFQESQSGVLWGSFSLYGLVAIAMELFSHVLFFMTIIVCIKSAQASSYRIVGFSYAFYFLSATSQTVLFEYLTALSGAIFLLVAYGAIMFAMWVLPSRRKKVPRSSEDSLPENELIDNVRDRCALLAERYKLTPRESEVLVLLSQGKTRASIQKELFLSDGTVKTHVTHIYEKFDVHTRQELFDKILNSSLDDEEKL